ncbi:MAG TPA: AAA family ATPase, partial [Gemmatimonadaceae bacterium]|nr:AAA family ATPase [Gemmatimonadaceae bacterium]
MRIFELMADKAAGQVRLYVLGNARIETDVAVIEPTAEIVFAAALYLILERQEAAPRRSVQKLLWPTAADATRAHRLRQTILKLRRLGVCVEATGQSRIHLRNMVVTVDFEESIGQSPTSWPLERLALLSGYDPQFSEPFLEWLDAKRSQMAGEITRSMIARIALARSAGDWRAVEEIASAVRKLSPYNEEIALTLAEALAMRGDKLEASRVLDHYLVEVGKKPNDLRIQASALRRRISEAPPAHPTADLPLFGRTDLLLELNAFLSHARAGQSQAVILLGEAGIGKSRLLAECASFAALQGVT